MPNGRARMIPGPASRRCGCFCCCGVMLATVPMLRAGLTGSPWRRRGLAPDRDVRAAVGGEGLPVPPGPAVTQPEPGELRHQVELGWPDVAERDGPVLPHPVGELDVVAPVLLGGVVKAVADDPPGAGPVGQDVLPGWQVAQVRDPGLDHEAPARGEVLGDVAEAGDLRFLRGEVVDRV